MIYLLHFERPINPDRPCQHYLGYAADVDRRLEDHASGQGSRLTQHALRLGIGWQLVRTWAGEKDTEKYLKTVYRNGRLLCPVCNPTAHNCCADLEIAPTIQRYKTGRIKISATVAALFNQRRWIFSADSVIKVLNQALGPSDPKFTTDQIYNALNSKTIRRSYHVDRRPFGWLHVRRIDDHG